MTNEKQEVTAEQYKVQRLKANFANRMADYEDVIATLQTKIAMLEQQLEQANVEVPELDAEASEVPPPPAPPSE